MMSIYRTWPPTKHSKVEARSEGDPRRERGSGAGFSISRKSFRSISNGAEFLLKNNKWGSTTNTTISGCCPKTRKKRKFVNQTQTFSFCSLDFSLFDMFFNVSFSDVSFCDTFRNVFSRPFPWTPSCIFKVILVPTASQGISDVWRGLGYIGEASLVM